MSNRERPQNFYLKSLKIVLVLEQSTLLGEQGQPWASVCSTSPAKLVIYKTVTKSWSLGYGFLLFITPFEWTITLIWLPGVFICKNIMSLLGKLVVLVPASWIHKTLQNLSCSYCYFSFPKLFFSPNLSRDLITQEEAIWRINNQVRTSGAFTWQYGGWQCFWYSDH